MRPIEVVAMEVAAAAVVAVAAVGATHCWVEPVCCPAVVRVFASSDRRRVGCRDQYGASCSTWQSTRSSEARSLLVRVERSRPQAGVERSQHGQPHVLCRDF